MQPKTPGRNATMIKKALLFTYSALLLTFLAGCDSGSGSKSLPVESLLWGEAKCIKKIDNATVTFTNADSGEVEWVGTTTDGLFKERIDLVQGEEYMVTITDGTIGDTDFTKTLKAYVPDYQSGDFIHVNILSTLLAAYIDVNNLTYGEAESQLKDRLKITADIKLAALPYHGELTRQFCSRQFARTAENWGDLNDYIKWLAEKLSDGDNSIQFDALGGVGEDTSTVASLTAAPTSEITTIGESLTKIVKEAGLGIAKGVGVSIGEELGDTAIGQVLALFGIENVEEEIFEELEDIHEELISIESSLTNIESEIQALQSQLGLTEDEIILAERDVNLYMNNDLINEAWDMLINLIREDDPTDAELAYVADHYLNDTYNGSTGVSSLVANYHSNIIGTSGYLKTYTDSLSRLTLTEDRDNLLNAYLMLENVFKKVITYQVKAIYMKIEATNYYLSNEMTIKPSAEEYYETAMTNYIEPELDLFMECVDELVIRYTDTRILLPRTENSLPIDTETVYARADYLAAALNPDKYGMGVVIRLIGPPNAVNYWLDTNPISLEDSEDSFTTSYVNGTESESSYRVLTTSISDLSFATKQYYIGAYRIFDTVNQYTLEVDKFDSIAVARLYLPVETQGNYTINCPLNSDVSDFSTSTFTANVGSCYSDATFISTDSYPLGQDSGTVLDTPVIYGNAVISAFDLYTLSAPTEVTSYYEIESGVRDWWTTPTFNYDFNTMSLAISMDGQGGSHYYYYATADIELWNGLTSLLFVNGSEDYASLKVAYNGRFHIHKNNSKPVYILRLTGQDILYNYKADSKKLEDEFNYDLSDIDHTAFSSLDFRPELTFLSYEKHYLVDGDKVNNDLEGQIELIQVFGEQ